MGRPFGQLVEEQAELARAVLSASQRCAHALASNILPDIDQVDLQEHRLVPDGLTPHYRGLCSGTGRRRASPPLGWPDRPPAVP